MLEVNELILDATRFRFMCELSTHDPARFRNMLSQALDIDEYRDAVDREINKEIDKAKNEI